MQIKEAHKYAQIPVFDRKFSIIDLVFTIYYWGSSGDALYQSAYVIDVLAEPAVI